MNSIHFKVNKTLLGSEGRFELALDVRFDLNDIIALFGESGAGKSTILRLLSGLESADSGYIRVGDEVWLNSDKNINLPPQKRRIGFVFQNYALFPHLNVYENICFALRKKQDRILADELLEIMELTHLKKAKTHQLSGGQAQRVALARSIASKPRILLLDEPFSALDLTMRQKLQAKIKEIHHRFTLTTLFASHHMSDIFALSSSVLALERGKVKAQGSPSTTLLPSNSDNLARITGEVISIVHIGSQIQIQILYEGKILNFTQPLAHYQSKPIQIGEQIALDLAINNPLIQRLNTLK